MTIKRRYLMTRIDGNWREMCCGGSIIC